MKYVVQWKCNRWVNCIDTKGKTIYFNSAEDAKDYVSRTEKEPRNNYRVAEYLGGRKYREVRDK